MAAFSLRCVIVALFLVQCYGDGDRNGNFSEVMQFVVNSSSNIRIHFHPGHVKNLFKIIAWSTDATSKDPVHLVAEQQRNILSWTVPLILANSFKNTDTVYANTSRIFCDNEVDHLGWGKNFTVTLSTASPTNVTLYLLVKKDGNFNITSGNQYSLSVSPSQTDYFFYRFSHNFTLTTVIEINSTSDACLSASIQNNQCPVFDLGVARSVHQTITNKGGMRILRSNYGEGFSLVLSAKINDSDCIKKYNPFDKRVFGEDNRTFHVTFVVTEIADNRTSATFFVLGMVVLACLVAVFIVFVFHLCGQAAERSRSDDNESLIPREQESVPEEQSIEDSPGLLSQHQQSTSGGQPEVQEESASHQSATEEGQPEESASQQSANEDSVGANEWTLPDELMVSDLAQNLQDSREKSFGFVWNLLLVVIFYGIPVTQLVWTYQKIADKTGDEDMCYYNYLCANPFWIFGDFNHIFSNVGYVLMGALFLCMVAHWKSKYQALPTGVPRHYGVFNAMGLALIGEGVLSACYHVCPSQFSFQFDVTFMYVMVVLCMVQLYKNRHSDVSLSHNLAFILLGLYILLATVGLLTEEVAVVAVFMTINTLVCIFLSLKAYFLGPVWDNLGNLTSQLRNRQHPVLHLLKPRRKARFICVGTAIAINIILSACGCHFFIEGAIDFGTFILIQLMGNAFLQTLIYFIFKTCVYCEGVSLQNVFYLLLSIILWISGAYVYFHPRAQWKESPAISRERNQQCLQFLNFYDVHDLWHLLSAGALYSTFMFLLTFDDNVAYKERTKIFVF